MEEYKSDITISPCSSWLFQKTEEDFNYVYYDVMSQIDGYNRRWKDVKFIKVLYIFNFSKRILIIFVFCYKIHLIISTREGI